MVLPAEGSAQSQNMVRKGEPVHLIVRPRVGDTLWLRVDQAVDMRAITDVAEQRSRSALSSSTQQPPPTTPPTIPPPASYGPRRLQALSQSTRMHLYAHSVVESSDLVVTTLLATTDSLLVWSGSAADDGIPLALALPDEGRVARVRVTTDGTMTVSDPPPGSMALGTTLAALPGMLPATAIAVGEKWKRDIPIPSIPIGGMRADGILRVTFQLDSASNSSKLAWISMRGTLQRSAPSSELPVGTRVITGGTIEGELVIDRARAWITDARTIVDVESEVKKEPMAPGTPVFLSIRVTQRVRAR